MPLLPNILILSSSEGYPIAEELLAEIETSGFADVSSWKHDVFNPASFVLEALTQELENVDFGVVILTPDDVTESRDQVLSTPRDNVVFELGLFIGYLGRHRCTWVHEDSSQIKLPSDLLGLVEQRYKLKDNMRPALAPVCRGIKRKVDQYGIRPKILRFMHEEPNVNPRLTDLSGTWAGYSPDGPTPDKQISTLEINQHGSIVRATIIQDIPNQNSQRTFKSEGIFNSGQLMLFYWDHMARDWVNGSIVLHLGKELNSSLSGKSLYYDEDAREVIAKSRVFERI